MNHYPHHIGDYQLATAHLSEREDLAYRRMLDCYYRDEKPFPDDIERIARQVRMPDATAEVEAVLREFFVLKKTGWRQKRCDLELREFRARSERARKNGKKGGRPPSRKPAQTLDKKPTWLATGTQTKTNQNHYPEPEPEPLPPTPLPPDEPGDALGSGLSPGKVAGLMRANGSQQAHPGHAGVRAIADSGVDESTLLAACEEGRRCQPGGFSPGYVLRILEGWSEARGKAPNLRGVRPPGEAERDEIFAGAR